MPANFAEAIRDGGGPAEWIWKGDSGARQSQEKEDRGCYGIFADGGHSLDLAAIRRPMPQSMHSGTYGFQN